MKKRFTEAQIVGFLREVGGVAVNDHCRKHGFSEGSNYLWRSKFGGMSISDAKRLKELEIENTYLEFFKGKPLRAMALSGQFDVGLHKIPWRPGSFDLWGPNWTNNFAVR